MVQLLLKLLFLLLIIFCPMCLSLMCFVLVVADAVASDVVADCATSVVNVVDYVVASAAINVAQC